MPHKCTLSTPGITKFFRSNFHKTSVLHRATSIYKQHINTDLQHCQASPPCTCTCTRTDWREAEWSRHDPRRCAHGSPDDAWTTTQTQLVRNICRVCLKQFGDMQGSTVPMTRNTRVQKCSIRQMCETFLAVISPMLKL